MIFDFIFFTWILLQFVQQQTQQTRVSKRILLNLQKRFAKLIEIWLTDKYNVIFF